MNQWVKNPSFSFVCVVKSASRSAIYILNFSQIGLAVVKWLSEDANFHIYDIINRNYGKGKLSQIWNTQGAKQNSLRITFSYYLPCIFCKSELCHYTQRRQVTIIQVAIRALFWMTCHRTRPSFLISTRSNMFTKIIIKYLESRYAARC